MDDAERGEVARLLGEAAEELEDVQGRLRSYLEDVCNRLKLDGSTNFQHRQVDKGRVKKLKSVVRALGENGLSPAQLWQIDDVVGGRVVVFTKSDAKILATEILEDPLAPLQDNHLSESNVSSAYRATHIKGRHEGSCGSIGCEIQIRTALQDAFGVVHMISSIPREMTFHNSSSRCSRTRPRTSLPLTRRST